MATPELESHLMGRLHDCLASALTDFEALRQRFVVEGFAAGEPRRLRLGELAGERKFCSSADAGLVLQKMLLADLVVPHMNRMSRWLPGWPTPRAQMLSFLNKCSWTDDPNGHELMLHHEWSSFAREANALPEENKPQKDRKSHLLAVFGSEAIRMALPECSKVPVPLWHPHKQWVDVAVKIGKCGALGILLTSKTPRPRKYLNLPTMQVEPGDMGVQFDVIEIQLWMVPDASISSSFEAYEILQPFTQGYREFNSLRGLRRIVQAHLAGAKLLFWPEH